MPDLPHPRDTDRHTDPAERASDRAGASAGLPRWVKVVGIVAIVVVVLVVVMLLFGGGHGPGRHGLPSGGY